MLRRSLCLVVALLLAAPPVSAAPEPAVTGRVLGADGRAPRGELFVRVTERQGAFDVLATLFTMSFGGPAGLLACLGGAGVCREAGVTTVRVGAGGRYAVPVPSGVGDYDVSVLSARGDTPVFHASLTVDVPVAGRRLPTIRLWDPAVRVAPRGDVVAFEWDALPDAYAPGATYRVNLTPDRENGTYGSVEVTGTTGTLDGREVEDVAGRGLLVATGRVDGVEMRWLAAPVRYPAPAGAPLSRGRPCTVTVEAARPVTPRTCWLTDGGFGYESGYPGARRTVCFEEEGVRGFPDSYYCGPRPVTAVTLDLGGVRDVGEVRWASCARCRVAVSADGTAWAPEQPVDDRSQAPVRFPPGTRARYVRVRADAPFHGVRERELEPTGPIVGPDRAGVRPNDLAMLGELSVWPPRPEAAAPPGDDRDGAAGRALDGRASRDRAAGGGAGSDLPVAGIALAFVVVVAGAYAAGRRGSRT